MNPVLEVDHLSKSFGGLAVTRDVSLDVRPGELHAVIGPNGAGKTTLIAQLFGQLAPSAGAIRLDGAELGGLPTHARVKRGLRRTFQLTNLVGELSLRDNLALAMQAEDGHAFRFWRAVASDDALQSRIEAHAAQFGLSERLDDPILHFSHGEQRLVELALALIGKARLILLDEPLAGLGREESHAVVARLTQLKGKVAMLLVEHDMDAVFALADRVSVLVRGALIMTGEPAAVRADPAVREAYLGEDA
jgi:branched-chain amino acid transport system ATP-binding protein